MDEYRVEVYDLKNGDAWQREQKTGIDNPNFTQNLFDWASHTFEVAFSDSQSAFWVQRVVSKNVNNGDRIKLNGDGTNIILLVYKEQRREIRLRAKLSLQKYLESSDMYIAFLNQKDEARRAIEQQRRKLDRIITARSLHQMNSLLDQLESELFKLFVTWAIIDDEIKLAKVEFDNTYEISLELNIEKMTKWLNNNQIGTNKWNQIQSMLVNDEQRVLARFEMDTVSYEDGHELATPFSNESFSSKWNQVEMPYDVVCLTSLPARDQNSGRILRNEIETKRREINDKCSTAATEIATKQREVLREMRETEERIIEKMLEENFKHTEVIIRVIESSLSSGQPVPQAILDSYTTLNEARAELLQLQSPYERDMRPTHSLPNRVIQHQSLLDTGLCSHCNGKGLINNRVCVHCDGKRM